MIINQTVKTEQALLVQKSGPQNEQYCFVVPLQGSGMEGAYRFEFGKLKKLVECDRLENNFDLLIFGVDGRICYLNFLDESTTHFSESNVQDCVWVPRSPCGNRVFVNIPLAIYENIGPTSWAIIGDRICLDKHNSSGFSACPAMPPINFKLFSMKGTNKAIQCIFADSVRGNMHLFRSFIPDHINLSTLLGMRNPFGIGMID